MFTFKNTFSMLPALTAAGRMKYLLHNTCRIAVKTKTVNSLPVYPGSRRMSLTCRGRLPPPPGLQVQGRALLPLRPGAAPPSWSLLTRDMCQSNTPMTESQIKSSMDEIGELFREARELLEDAREVKDTVYFTEDMKEASEAVDETLKKYDDLLKRVNDSQKQTVLRTIGLKMEELRAQKNALEEEMKHE